MADRYVCKDLKTMVVSSILGHGEISDSYGSQDKRRVAMALLWGSYLQTLDDELADLRKKTNRLIFMQENALIRTSGVISLIG